MCVEYGYSGASNAADENLQSSDWNNVTEPDLRGSYGRKITLATWLVKKTLGFLAVPAPEKNPYLA